MLYKLFNNKAFAIAAFAIAAIILSLFSAKPKQEEYKNIDESKDLYRAITIKKNDLTNDLSEFSPESGEAKYVFRFTIPFIMKVANLSPIQMFYIQLLLGGGIFVLCAFLALDIFNDNKQALLLTLSFATTYFGRCYFIDFGSPMVTLSFFLVLFCIVYRRKPLIYIPALIALFFNDERGAMAFSIISLFMIFNKDNGYTFSFSSFFNKHVIILSSTFVFCLALRLIIQLHYKINTPFSGTGIDIFVGQWRTFNLGVFSGFGGLLVVIFFSLYYSFKKKNYTFLLFFVLCFVLFVVVGGFVSDMTKSFAYASPLALLGAAYMHDVNIRQRQLWGSALVVNLFFPCIVVVGPLVLYYYNVSFDVFFKILNIIQ